MMSGRANIQDSGPAPLVALRTGSDALILAVCVTVPILFPGRLVPDGVLRLIWKFCVDQKWGAVGGGRSEVHGFVAS